MIIIKFAMFAFLVGMTLLLAMALQPRVLVGGPYYFMEMPGNRNPTKPNLRLNGWQAYHRKNLWRVWFDGTGHPVEMKLFRDGAMVRHEKLVYDKFGTIRQRFRG